jgi:two-component system nitrogen regulation response regulator NtrX
VIAATNRNLAEEVERRRFRADLYYRLNVLSLHVPPLRERPEDIPKLIEHFLGVYRERFNRPNLNLSSEARRLMQSHAWPGNVRELRNMMERLVIMQPRNRIDLFDLPDEILRRTVLASAEPEESPTLQDAREKFERNFILQKLAEYRGNISRAAQVLGVERSNLYRKMKQLGIPYLAKENGDAD